jgi:hypothetical protein
MRLRYLLPALLVAMLAAPATASAAQTLTVGVASNTATITAPDGWTIDNCYGSITLAFGGVLSWSSFDAQPAPNEVTVIAPLSIANAIGGFTALTATCSLSHWVITYSPVTTHHTRYLDGAYTSARSRNGNCGFKGFSWNGHHALQLDCWGGTAAYAKASWRITPPAGAFNLTDASYGTRLCCSPWRGLPHVAAEQRRQLDVHGQGHAAPGLRHRLRRDRVRHHPAGRLADARLRHGHRRVVVALADAFQNLNLQYGGSRIVPRRPNSFGR